MNAVIGRLSDIKSLGHFRIKMSMSTKYNRKEAKGGGANRHQKWQASINENYLNLKSPEGLHKCQTDN